MVTLRRHPVHITERKPGPWDECTLCSAGMGLDAVTQGRIQVTRLQMRLASGTIDRVQLSDATNLNDSARAFANIGGAKDIRLERPQYGLRITPRQALERSVDGWVILGQGMYSSLPRHFGRWDMNFYSRRKSGHCMLFMWDGVGFHLDDPLAPAGWKGEYIEASDLLNYLESILYQHTFAFVGAMEGPIEWKPGYSPAPPPPLGAPVQFVNSSGYPRTIHVPAGIEVLDLQYNSWYRLRDSTKLVSFGLADSRSDTHVVRVTTGKFYKDGEGRPTVQLVRGPGIVVGDRLEVSTLEEEDF